MHYLQRTLRRLAGRDRHHHPSLATVSRVKLEAATVPPQDELLPPQHSCHHHQQLLAPPVNHPGLKY